MEAELNLDPDSHPEFIMEMDPDPNLQIISVPDAQPCNQLQQLVSNFFYKELNSCVDALITFFDSNILLYSFFKSILL